MKPALILFTILISWNSNAQSISPEVLSSAGTTNNNSSLSLQWTLGELFVHSFDNEESKLSQGYNQSFLNEMSTALSSVQLKTKVLIQPNPATNHLYIETAEKSETHYIIYNYIGQIILNGKFKEINTIDISMLTAGNYYLGLTTSDGEKGIYAFVKSNK